MKIFSKKTKKEAFAEWFRTTFLFWKKEEELPLHAKLIKSATRWRNKPKWMR